MITAIVIYLIIGLWMSHCICDHDDPFEVHLYVCIFWFPFLLIVTFEGFIDGRNSR